MGIGDHLFPDGVNGRIGNLSELLLEVVEKQRMTVAEHRQRDIRAHGGGGLPAGAGHGQDGGFHILIGVAERLVQPVPLLLGIVFRPLVGHRQLAQLHRCISSHSP